MKRSAIFKFFLVLFFCQFSLYAEALSLGPLVLSPSNDGKFYAQVNINHETNENVDLYLATPGDYKRLNIQAPPFLEKLSIQAYPALNRHDKSFFIVYSEVPVNAREFNLVVKARSTDGIILKNYDVIQTGKLQLSLRNIDKEEELVDLLGGNTAATQQLRRQQTPQAGQNVIKPKKKIEKKAETVVVKKPVKKVVPLKQSTRKEDEAKKIIAEAARKALRKENIEWVSDFSGFYGATKGGETVADIVERLNIPPALRPQAQILLIQDNPNLFKKENNFVLEKGKYLTYTDLVNRALKISPMDAYKDLNKLYGKGEVTVETKKRAKILMSTGLEGEMRDAWDVFLDWKESWENNDLNGHMKTFSKNFNNGKNVDLQSFTAYKKKIFTKFPNPKIKVKSLFLKKFQGKFYIYYQQQFTSKYYNSLGGKVLKMQKEDGKWVISYERFFGSLIKEDSSPYTVHVSSFKRVENAYKKVLELEKAGYNAFVGYFNLGEIGSWYRVFAERLATKSEGIGIAKKLKEENLSRRETVFFLPYAIEVANNYKPEEVTPYSNGLKPYSIYKLGEMGSQGRAFPKRHLLLGSYPTIQHAEKALSKLKENGIKAKVIAP